MAELTGSVGEGGRNAWHDVALVQLTLFVAKDTKGGRYYLQPYDGLYSGALSAAISAFQKDRGFLETRPGGPPPTEKAGIMQPQSATWKKLVAELPDELRTVRGAEGIGVLYLDMGEAAKAKSVAAIQNPGKKLENGFKAKIVRLVEEFYRKTGVVLTVQEPWGWWRTFDDQVGLSSQGGPGESIHCYGRALDMGFRGLEWVNRRAQVQAPLRGDLTDGTLDPSAQAQFWKARNDVVQGKLALFPTIMAGDKAHIQDLKDEPVDSAGSLIELLELVGPRKMKWESFEMTPTKYKCDLGLGGAKYLVGTALDIWVLDPKSKRYAAKLEEKGLKPKLRLKAEDLAAALNQRKTPAGFSVDEFLGRKPGTTTKDELTAADITPADLRAVHVLMHGEFEAAAKNWNKWKPIYYPSRGPRRSPSK